VTGTDPVLLPALPSFRKEKRRFEMNKFRFIINALAIFVFTMAFASFAHAQATRTWVSGVGDDANPCDRTAPCKTFAGAISKTANSGEINCLDPGGFGGVVITKSIAIICEEEIGHILVSGTNGIIITLPNTTDKVTLRGIEFNGVNTGINAISFTGAGTLHVQEVLIRGFANSGINFAPNQGIGQLFVSDETIIHDNNAGNTSFAGILIRPIGGASANVSINGVQMKNNANGIFMDGSGGGGASNLVVKDSEMSGNSNCGIAVASSGPVFSATVANSVINLNVNVGAAVAGSGATLRLGGNTIAHNVTGVSNAGGTLESFKNNQVVANLNNGTPMTAVSVSGNILN